MVKTSHNKTIRIDATGDYQINSDNETIIINTTGAVIIKFPHMLKDNDRINIISVVATPDVVIKDGAGVDFATLSTDYGYIQVEYNTSADAYVSRAIVTEAVTSMNADDVIVVPAGNITSTDVQAALEELDGFIDVIVQEGTTASNGLTKTALDIALGGTLAANTLIDSGAFYLDMLGNLRMRPTGISSTSQNKTLQLANTTGAVSLVNKGIYYKRSATLNIAFAQPVPNGLTATWNTNVASWNPSVNTGTSDFTGQVSGIQSSKIVDSSVLDSSLLLYSSLPVSPAALVGLEVRVKVSVIITSDIDIIAMPFLLDASGVPATNELFANIGWPRLVSGIGYREAIYCKELQRTKVETEFIVTAGASLGNIGFLGIYRNLGIAATDATIANLTCHGWSFEIEQL